MIGGGIKVVGMIPGLIGTIGYGIAFIGLIKGRLGETKGMGVMKSLVVPKGIGLA